MEMLDVLDDALSVVKLHQAGELSAPSPYAEISGDELKKIPIRMKFLKEKPNPIKYFMFVEGIDWREYPATFILDIKKRFYRGKWQAIWFVSDRKKAKAVEIGFFPNGYAVYPIF